MKAFNFTKGVKKAALLLTMILTSFAARADLVAETVSVTNIYIYGDYGNGDVIFKFNPSTLSGCSGGWIAPTQPGAKNLVAALVIAKQTATPISITLSNTDKWPGNGNVPFCKVYNFIS